MIYRSNTGTRIERGVTRPTPARERRRRTIPRRADTARNSEATFNHTYAIGHHRGFTNGFFAGIVTGLVAAAVLFAAIQF